MKTIILNASPRKNWNTAQLLKSARKGAESVGAETEYIDLYDLSFTGCRSCMACKRKGGQRCHCFWKDDLSPVLDRVFSADALIIGSPVYLSDTTSQFHAFVERMHFVCLSYDDYHNYFAGKVNAGVIFTMNAPIDVYKRYYEQRLTEQAEQFRMLNGKVMVMPCCDTLQVKDYSKYDMAAFDENHKNEVHNRQFPVDLESAFQMGAALSRT
ncbi:MAG: flavodoxin family protein [Abditibacteriota bacterium]|nr:flavodoxin family protein [Abditibacteriota bacterium]